MRAADARQRAASHDAKKRVRATEMPIARAAAGESPTARTCMPQRVERKNQCIEKRHGHAKEKEWADFQRGLDLGRCTPTAERKRGSCGALG